MLRYKTRRPKIQVEKLKKVNLMVIWEFHGIGQVTYCDYVGAENSSNCIYCEQCRHKGDKIND